MDIEKIKVQARELGRKMAMNVEDVDDTVATRRVRLKSEITKLLPSAERLGAKGHDDASERINAVTAEVYAHAAAELECEEEITPQVVVREIVVALDHIKTKTGYTFAHYAIRECAKVYHDKQDLRSVRELLELMPQLRKQVVGLRKNYTAINPHTGLIVRTFDGFSEVLSAMDYVDFCTEFLEREKHRLESGLEAA
ncbi:hypothetical protein HFO56_24205 [Rhizobium laguerreae]|uniref:hypothetical protein n=1 Tax=Rhizobium laguerreae TaxID=1076926 RepID=UPI001C910183|nr:hypothetical protein [Rhizobium laguerreae]MBY3155433.1 hypothetical protein [Rhizobium laguerreae]